MKNKLFVIAGPSGCGESTITKEIIKMFPNFTRLVTATSRSPRLDEKNEIDYYFFSKNDFEEEIEKGNVLEYTYIKNRDTYYGSYKPDLEEKLKDGLNIIVNPDIVGAKFFKEKYAAVTIFIKPESLDSLERRLLRRNPNISQEELKKRLNNAENEINNEEYFYDYSIINEEGKLDEAIAKTARIIQNTLDEQKSS